MMRPRTPQRERSGRTPNRERPTQQNAGYANLPVQEVLEAYAAHFPALPKDLTALPRGRKERRGSCPWDDLGDSRASSRSVSRGHFREENEEESAPKGGRSRACSFDMAADSTQRSEKDSRPTTPRGSILKKPRSSIGDGDAEKEKQLKKMQEEIQARLKEMVAFYGPESDSQTQLASMMTNMLDSAVIEVSDQSKQSAASVADTTKEVTKGQRRLSNPSTPRPMEAPGGSSWEYPLSKDEKKARVVMISSAEIECLTEEVEELTDEMARMKLESSR